MRLLGLRELVQAQWRAYIWYVILLVAVAGLLMFRLGTVLPGFSASEITTLHSSGLHTLLQNPVNAPYLLLVSGLSHIHADYLVWGRVVSVACGLLTIILFCGLTWYWHGRRNALLGTVLFATSAWFLHTARWGTPDVLLFFIVALAACYAWLHRTGSSWALLIAFVLLGISLYIPGMVWFVVAGLLWRWRSIDQTFKKNLWAVTAGGIFLLAAIVPLGLAIRSHPEVAKVLAGLPAEGWPQPFEVLHNLLAIPLHLFVQGPVMPERWLGNVPIVDVFTAAMFFLGGYLYIRHAGLKRVQLTAAALIIGALLVSLGGSVSLTIIVPFIYSVAAAGIGFMLDRWLEVFPRNAIAQGAGYTLIGLAMLSACVYSMAHYYAAWPNAKATRQVYSEHQR